MDSRLDRAKWFLYRNFESVLVVILVASLLGIHWLIDDIYRAAGLPRVVL